MGGMPETHDLRVRFKNIPPGAESDIPAALNGFDVVVIAESHKRRMAKLVDTDVWEVLQGPRSKGRVAVLLRRERKLRVVRWSTPILNHSHGLSFPAAGRYSVRVTFQDMLTGRWVQLEGQHDVPHADKDTEPGVLTTNPRRGNVLEAIASGIARLPARLWGVEIIVGDKNVDLDSDLAKHDFGMIERYNRAGFYSDVQLLGPVTDTHGRMEYDWVLLRLLGKRKSWTRPNGRVWLAEHGTGPKKKSDHRDRWFVLRSTVRKGWSPR